MSIKVNYDTELMELMDSIFYHSPSEEDEFLPIIKEMKNIPNIISFINKDNNLQTNLDNNICLIFFLKNLFSENNDLIPLFIKRCNKDKKTFLESLVNLYLEESIVGQSQTLLEDLINNINFTVSVNKDIFEYIYQKLSFYFNIEQNSNGDKITYLSENVLLKYLRLLNIFYTDIKNENKDINEKGDKKDNKEKSEKKSRNPEDKIIRNYFYFNGLNSKLTLSLNKSSNNINIDTPTLVEGLTLAFYVNLDKNILDYYFKTVLLNSNVKVSLIKLIIGEHQISLELKSSESFSIVLDNKESNKIKFSSEFKYNLWNSIILMIEPKSITKKGVIKIAVNECVYVSSLSLPKNFNVNEKVDNIILFENLLGKVTSISLFSFQIDDKLLNFFNSKLYGGFYKNRLLFKFLHSIDKKFCQTIQDYSEYERFKRDNPTGKIYNISIGAKDIHKNKIISIFCPFLYNKYINIIDDVFGVFTGKLNSEYDGVNIYSNNIKNVIKLGGINNLLPIAELMFCSLKDNTYFIEKNLLTEGTLLEYLKIIKQILNHHKGSNYGITNNYFFSSLALFLEKFPSYVFTINIINIFIEIYKETFRYKIEIDNNIQEESSRNYGFISIILFNEKIFSKFESENQLKLWDGIYNLFKNDNRKIKESLDIPKIINLLRFYDKDRYQKFCCKKHGSILKCKNENDIMQPELNSRVGKLYDIIQLYLDKIESEKDHNIILYSILSLDLSSCLKKKIVQIYLFHFISDKNSDKIKERTLSNLLNNNYFEITEYALSVSLLDVRSEIFKLMHYILLKYKTKVFEYFNKSSLNQSQIFFYISGNIIPIDAKIKQISEEKKEEEKNPKQIKKKVSGNYHKYLLYKDNLLGKVEDQNLLAFYFDQKIYDDDINFMWGLLNSWITENATVEPVPPKNTSSNPSSKTLIDSKKEKVSNEGIIKFDDKYSLIINPFILYFTIEFVSNVKPYFIDSFIASINTYLKDDGVQNKDVIIKDKKFFQWLIDTIFFFHNKENESVIDDKDLLPSIRKNSLEVINQLFRIKTSLKDIENKIYYLMEYSFYFKNRFNNSNNNLKEIVRITRLLLEDILKSNDKYYNIISVFCFEFMFFHKNNEEVLSNFSCQFQRNSLLDRESLNKTIKKSKEDDNVSLKKNITKIFFENEDIDIGDTCNTDRGPRGRNMNLLSNQTTFDSNQNNEGELIPNYLYQGIYSIQLNHSQIILGTQSKKTLKNIWSDYKLYSIIINHYRKHIWGAEKLFKTVKMEYKSADNLFDSCQNLLKNYGEQKEFKNILFKKIKRLLIIDDDYQNGINKINLLYINLILLCFSMDIAGVLTEQEEITQWIIEFLIFCIMASININQTEDTYNYIQKKLYDTLSFGLLFLKEKDQVKFRELMFYLIEPFFEGVTSHPNLKKIFGSKKTFYKNTAIYKVFIKTDESSEQKTTKLEVLPKKKDISGSVPKKKITNLLRKNSAKKNKESDKKKGNKLLLFLRSYPAQVSKTIFGRVLNFYKEEKYLFNLDNNLLLFYFKKDKEEYEKDKENTNSVEYLFEAEKKRINIFMKKQIPKIFGEINKTSISTYLEEKKRRNRLKKIKKSLFSWNGFWRNKNLFVIHPEYLKFKIKNHFCKDMSKIILSPILDLKYYLPKFSKFDVSNLFNKDDYKYNMYMDVDEILNYHNNTENQNNIIADLIKKNEYNFNYLESLYKYQYNYIWDNYYNINYIEQKNDDRENKTSNAKEIFELLFQNKLNSINEENVHSENIYTCCIVKPTHHIKGYATTEKNSLTFTYCPDNEAKELLEKDPSYDKDMGACFGSTFKRYYKDKDIINIEILLKSIELMFIRTYFYQETGLEIYTYDKKSYFLNFKSNQELLKFINDIKQHEKFRTIKCHGFKHKKLIGYCKWFNVYTKKKSLHPTYIIDEWQNNNISTFECLMWLNIFAGRSFNDLTQYPVFPWIITNYQTEKLTENDFRNLSIPVGMFDFNEKAEMRKETFIEFYDTLKNDLKESTPNFHYDEFLDKFYTYFEHYNNKKSKKDKDKDKDLDNPDIGEGQINKIGINQLPYFYGSHYSNPTYVSHYLTRLFPHASISIEIHGDKFDDPNRMFISLYRTFETASTLKDDIRELIPEFYVLPEMFLNINNFNLSQDKLDSEGNKIVINNVELPPWCNNRNANFVVEMRKNLEKINLKINKWIDLIFGYLQKGEKAEENHNIFMLNTYEGMVNIENIKDVDEKNAMMRLVEVGVTPLQIFSSESKPRNDMNQILAKGPYSNSKELFLWECNELGGFKISMYKYHKIIQKLINDYKQYKDSDNLILPRIIKIKAINKNEIRIFTNCNFWFNIKIIKNENKYIIEESALCELNNISSKFAPSYQISNIQTPIVVFGNNKFIIRGGFWDGRLEINVLNPEAKEEKDNINFCIHNQECPVITMEISKNEDLLICGTIYGCIVAYQIEYINNNSNIKLNLIKKLYDHNSSINSISINNNLNIFATCAKEDNIYLYLLPTFKVFRVIKISDNNNGNNDDGNELQVANNIFLSYSPLPCLSVYINSKRIFKSYTINGEFIGECLETNNTISIKCSIIFNDFTFCDYVIYGTDDGMVKIRSFPDMNLISFYSSFECYEITCLELSLDKRYCYAWGKGGDIFEIKDISIKEPNEVEQKKFKF